jgi:hypothetical protein
VAERRRSPSAPIRQDDAYYEALVCETVRQLQSEFDTRDRQYRYTDSVLWSTYPVEIPDAYQTTTRVIRSPLQLNIVNTIAAALSVNPAQVSFEPVGRGSAGQLNAELRQAFFEASWRRQEQESGRQLLRLFLWSMVARGLGVLKTIERSKSAWRGYTAYSKALQKRLDDPDDPEYGEVARKGDEEKKRGAYDEATEKFKRTAPYPIASTDVPADQFYFWRSLDGLRVAAEISEVPYLEALERYGAGLDRDGRVVRHEGLGLPRGEWEQVMSGLPTLTLYEVWWWDVCYYCLGGPGQKSTATPYGSTEGTTLVRNPVKHGYGDPYTRTLRGPYFPAYGITSGARTPDREGLGVLFPFLSLFPALDAYLTIQSNAAFQTGFPAYKRPAPPAQSLTAALGGGAASGVAPYGLDGSEQDALGAQTQRVQPGMIYPYDIQPVEQPRAGVDLDKSQAALRGLVELALPAAVQGVVSGDTSGYALNQAAHLARLAWDPIVKNAQVALSQRTGFESWLIQARVGEPVYAWSGAPGTGGAVRRALATAQKGPSGWLGVGPDDLGGVHRYTVTLDPDVPANRALEVQTHESLVRNNFESVNQAVEALGGDPGETERQIIVANVKKSPPVQERLMERIQQLLGMLDAQKLAAVGAGPTGTPNLPPEILALLQQMEAAPPAGPPGPPGANGAGPAMAGLGGLGPLPRQAFAPGMGMPNQPTPQGSVTGMGPGGQGGSPPGNVAGTPWQPVNPPAGAQPIPGVGPTGV